MTQIRNKKDQIFKHMLHVDKINQKNSKANLICHEDTLSMYTRT